MEGISTGDTEEDYGLIRPSLIKSLRSILDQYPDDGQILKELLQNAEDAGAKKAQFMFDGHSYGTSSLYQESMAQFQGPSLFAFNDALFDEKDWKGIRMLQDSIKEKDPMKVGRFGLGFKSVLHLTDMPSVISGDRIYMIDPHEKYFLFQEQRTTGKRWLLREHKNQIAHLHDQFAPYKDKFSCDERAFTNGYYKGTMFRFPLRRQESALSDTLYDEQRINELFKSFEVDAHMVILFLKNLECVELLMRSRDQKEPEVKFRVSISRKYEDSLTKRREFSNRIKEASYRSGNCLSVTYPLEIETVAFDRGMEKSKKTYAWLVNEYFGGSQVSTRLRRLQTDPSLSYIPVVGTAMPLQQTYSTDIKVDSEESPSKKTKLTLDESDSHAVGQIFCFLPLPVEQKSSTGLPVHVNGYFSVSQNRRHLKWPTTSQNYENDKSLLWNYCLLSELIPKSYCDLILEAVALNHAKTGIVMVSDVEHALPNMLEVDEKWQVVLEKVFRELFQHKIFHSQMKGGKWLRPAKCVFDCMKEDTSMKEVVWQVLLAADVPVVSIPRHILMAMGAYFDEDLREISSEVVRKALHKNESSYADLPADKKLLLLRYILKDGNFREIDGIKLLPLESNEFVKYSFKRGTEPLFICTPDCPAVLLPGLEHMFLKGDLDEDIMKKLKKLAEKGLSQLRVLDAPIVVSLLQKILPKKQGMEDTMTLDEMSKLTPNWLEKLWIFLRKHFPGDLGLLTDLPVLPLNCSLPMTLVPIRLPSSAVCHSAMGAELPADMCEILKDIGVHVVEELPVYVQNHAAVIGNYVRLPLPPDVVECMKEACEKSEKSAHAIFAGFTADQRNALVSFLNRISPHEITEELICFLRQLPLFECTNENGRLVSVAMVDRAAPNYDIPVFLDQDYLKLPSEEYMKIAKLLGVQVMSNTSLFSKVLLPKVKSRSYSNVEIQEIMEHILANIHAYVKEDPKLYKKLSDVPFVITESGSIDKPSSLFDPDVQVLRDLFACENRFPSQNYAERERLQLLRKIGLQTVSDVKSKDLLYSARSIDEECSQNTEENVNLKVLQNKSMALVQFISDRPQLLSINVNGQMLKEWLKDMTWVPILQEKPVSYPQNMTWKGEQLKIPFAKPEEVAAVAYASLVGSQMLVLCKSVPVIEKPFRWNVMPDAVSVVCHLGEVVQTYKAQEKAGYLAMITEVYRFLQQIDTSELLQCLHEMNIEEWVWQGDGFTSVKKIFPKRQFIDLSPYIFSVPTEMQEFEELFTNCGMEMVCPSDTLAAILKEIRRKYEDSEGIEQEEVDRDLMLVVDVLNHIKTLDRNPDDLILMPTQTSSGDTLRLMPSSEVTYCDTEWLRQGIDMVTFDEQDGIFFIHDNVPVSTAEALHVPTLMSRMLHAEELEITGFGQTQPLTDRLRQLLEDYTDGLAIPKELIQNADDAHATVVKFLYDQRTNTEHQQFLIDAGMKGCQGPALWAYNNAVFTDADFHNIVKLGGATKETELDKIGKFGLGFNAVYNVTDVPSFVSRNNIVIFDPHTKHLGRSIKDRSKPGIKIDMQKNKTLMRKLTDQFKPYEDVFSCKIGPETEGFFDGTLFRLPLRTHQQAARSEISHIYYSHQEVMKLLEMTIKQSHNLLLFTQNVVKVEFYHLEDGKDPSEAELLFEVHKEPVKIIRELKAKPPKLPKNAEVTEAQLELIQSSNYLSAVSQFLKTSKENKNKRSFQIPQVPQSSMAIKVIPSLTDVGQTLLKFKHTFESSFWLISACMGQEKALQFSQNHKPGEFLPVGGVAMALTQVGNEDGYVPKTAHRGLAFCFLPLPIPTEMMLHINGSFAIQSSRKCLAEKTDDDKHSEKYQWNQLLVEDAVMHSYIQLLVDIKSIFPPNGTVNLCDTWPTHCAQYFRPLLYSFIRTIASLPKLEVMFKEGKPVELSHIVFLDPDFIIHEGVKAAVMKVFSGVVKEQEMISLSGNVLRKFKEAGCEEFVKEKTLTVLQFFQNIYFPNIASFDVDTRDVLLLFAIKTESKDLDLLLKANQCIPVSPNGEEFRRPAELIYPYGMAAKLYTAEDGRFPVGKVAERNTVTLLEALGMKVNHVDWEHLIERAQSVANLYTIDETKGRQRVQNIWNAIDEKVRYVHNLSHQQVKAMMGERKKMAAIFKGIPFMPTQKPPPNYPVKWRDFDKDAPESWKPMLLCSEDLFPHDMCYLVSATQFIMDDRDLSTKVKKFLGFEEKEVLLPYVITQVQHAMQVEPEMIKSNRLQYEQLEKVFSSVYGFLQKACQEDESLVSMVQPAFQDQKCLLIDGRLVEPKKVSFMKNVNCAPYLFSLPNEFERKFEDFMKNMGVRERFEVEDYMLALQDMHEEYSQRKMDEEHVGKSIMLSRLLNEVMEKNQLGRGEVEEKYGCIYVPNDNGILQPASTLCFNDCAWLTKTETMKFAHPKLALAESARLGVRTKKEEVLKKYTSGIAFGQKHNLVDGIHQLLRNYPLDHEILKEMIQNADDAGATKIHFVLDYTYHKRDLIFDESWKPLQGPALLVYNNKPFTMNDLEAVQLFGEGSKAYDPVKTGQYGLGFSSVYHLTDVPCILTAGPEVGKTLCVFDPLCSHVPGATTAEPGKRFEEIQELQKQFAHVFDCFHMDTFSVEDATLFRFPLRTSRTSKISSEVISTERMKRLMMQLKEEIFDILLFTNNVVHIKLSFIGHTGQLETWYEAKSIINEREAMLRQEFIEAIKRARDILRKPNFSLSDITTNNVVFIKNVKDSENVCETWCISQNIGIGEDTQVPTVVEEAFKKGSMVLLPHGGVAYMLCKQKDNSLLATPRARKVCCVLPLPVKTELNVHVNGHFALGSQNRRQLASEEESESFMCWNTLLFEKVIAPAFVKLLEKHRTLAFRQHGDIENDMSVITMQKYLLQSYLNVFQNAFPNYLPKEPQLNVLVKAFYTTIALQQSAVLPCVKELMTTEDMEVGEPSAENTRGQKSWTISWLPPTGTGTKKAFFISKDQEEKLGKPDSSTKSSAAGGSIIKGIRSAMSWLKGGQKPHNQEIPSKRTLKDVLLSCGFKVLDVGQKITENFMESGVEIDFMSPEGVVKFFKSYSSSEPACDINSLPCVIEDTPFKDAETLIDVVMYCKEAATEDFLQQLEGLPLLLTNDGILRVFGPDDVVFSSQYCDLLKSCGERFVHKLLQESLFKDIDYSKTDLFQELTIQDLEGMLHMELPREIYYDVGEMVAWDDQLSREWFNLLWEFLVEFMDNSLRNEQDTGERAVPLEKQIDEVYATEITSMILMPLKKWAIIPVFIKGQTFLTSIEYAYRVICCDRTEKRLFKVFQELELPWLNPRELRGTEEWKLATRLVTTPTKPNSVLRLLYDLALRDKLVPIRSAQEILKYFCEYLEIPEALLDDEENVEKLKALPFYKTVYKDTIALTNCQVYTIPSEIPTDGIDVWRSKTGMVFLERVEELKPLYDFIGCASITAVEVYCQFIFQHFELFTPDQRMVHLYHVYTKYVKGEAPGGVVEDDKNIVIETLRKMPLIEDEDGDLQPASEFYDPENRLFEIIVPRAKFPPRVEGSCFKESEWYVFLRRLGLVKEVTEDMFLEYTKAVAMEGKDPTSASAELKSKALCNHMFQMKSDERHAIMQKISPVPFVAPAKVPFNLSTVCLQHGDCGNGLIPYMSFSEGVSSLFQKVCWSSANILPSWADPVIRDLQGEETTICKNLGIPERPRIEVVISHIRNLCENEHMEEPDVARTRLDVFRATYRFLEETLELSKDDSELLVKELSKLPCIVVEGGRLLVKPEQTVFNIYDGIKYYLYKVPLELGDVQKLFKALGSTDRATGKQYASVLSKLHQENGRNPVNPNDMRIALKATRGYFDAIEEQPQNKGGTTLYLPNEKSILQNSCQLVFNNSPYYYERVKGCRINFMVDLSQCGIKKKNVDELVDMMPADQRPRLLSDLTKEHLDKKMESYAVQDGTAANLETRIKSDDFKTAVARLIKHGMYKAGSKVMEEEMFNTIDRLSNIRILTVPAVRTRLYFDTKEIERSDLERQCFATAIDNGLGDKLWYVYIEKDAVLDQELLIPLVEVINNILSGMLRDSVLYLLPLLSCKEKDMHRTLDSLNIKVDVDTQAMRQVALLPQLGTEVSEEDARRLEAGFAKFEDGEYVGYQQTEDHPVVYAQVDQASEMHIQLYMIKTDAGSREARATQLYRFVRK